ncbi:recombinase-like helix-turn-helix domain-containing protein [Oceanobacter mangrovi]|uniref:recombinase-like helix-turn-helix domain-containing protein n=1 Tax=Oceanobacter mangrovi TaxID=2862510 RepID=UPI001C8DCA19|nr:recombinase-like helix-turn-helix domain-containing protein [Oceanobacter mangrovi]
MTDRYLEPHQARTRDNTPFEDLLADSIERAFAEQIHDLPTLVDFLNRVGPPCPTESGLWTADSYQTLMSKLGE